MRISEAALRDAELVLLSSAEVFSSGIATPRELVWESGAALRAALTLHGLLVTRDCDGRRYDVEAEGDRLWLSLAEYRNGRIVTDDYEAYWTLSPTEAMAVAKALVEREERVGADEVAVVEQMVRAAMSQTSTSSDDKEAA